MHWVDAEAPERVRGDRNRLRQILLNLLSNAVKFTCPGRRRAIGVDRGGQRGQQLVATTMLQQRGLRAELVRTGLEAVQMSAAREYAVIFMDCHMPALDGYQATERIRAARPGQRTPIIAMTSTSPPRLTNAPDQDPLDAAALLRLRHDLDANMRERLLDTYEESLQKQIISLQDALRTADAQELRRILHLLKGSSATMGARDVSEACQAFGLLVGAEESTLIRGATELDAIADRTVDALRTRLLDNESTLRRAASPT